MSHEEDGPCRDRDTHPSSTTQHSGPRFKTFDERNATSPRNDATDIHPPLLPLASLTFRCPRLGPAISYSRRFLPLCASPGCLLFIYLFIIPRVAPSSFSLESQGMELSLFSRLEKNRGGFVYASWDQLAYRSLSREGRKTRITACKP